MTTRIEIRLIDAEPLEFETSSYACTADRVHFERRFDVSTQELKSSVGVFRDEWTAFFAWRCATRAGVVDGGQPFDDFVEQLQGLTIEDLSEDEPEDEASPLAPAPPPGS